MSQSVVSVVRIKPITETRDFAYFITGIRKLKLEIQNEKSNRKTQKQQSQEPSV
jgi:hypothetical protein